MSERKPQTLENLRDGQKLWLWKNGDHYLAFAHEYPTYDGGDPMTLGEPAAVAIFRHSDPPAPALPTPDLTAVNVPNSHITAGTAQLHDSIRGETAAMEGEGDG